jgi:hypothetical protein
VLSLNNLRTYSERSFLNAGLNKKFGKNDKETSTVIDITGLPRMKMPLFDILYLVNLRINECKSLFLFYLLSTSFISTLIVKKLNFRRKKILNFKRN